MAERKNGRARNSNRDAGSSSGDGISASSDNDRDSAGLFSGDGSGGVKGESSAVDNGPGDSSPSDTERTGDSGRSVVGSSRSGEGTGADSGAGDSGGGDRVADATRTKRKYTRRTEKEKLDSGAAPRLIESSRLRGGRKKKAHDYTVPFAKGFKVLYEMPRYAGWGDHWPISDGDSLLLGGKLNDVVQELPKGQVHRLAEFFDKYINPYLPIASFATAMYLVTEPRITLSKTLAQEARDRADAARETGTTTERPFTANGSAESNGSMHAGVERATAASINSERLSDETI